MRISDWSSDICIELRTGLIALVSARPDISTGALLEHFAEREEAAALQKLASQTLPGDEARWHDELFDTIAQLDRQVLQLRVAELQAKQRESGLDDADKTELRELLQAQHARLGIPGPGRINDYQAYLTFP